MVYDPFSDQQAPLNPSHCSFKSKVTVIWKLRQVEGQRRASDPDEPIKRLVSWSIKEPGPTMVLEELTLTCNNPAPLHSLLSPSL